MNILQPLRLEELTPCPYLPGRQKRFESFLAGELTPRELTTLLEEGWRKFGPYFFRPSCPSCRQCIPLRVVVEDFHPSRSQKRVLRRNAGLRVSFGPLRFSERIFEIYNSHSQARFGQKSGMEDFLLSFFLPSCPSLQTEISQDGELVGVGFLDRGDKVLSSVYFCFDPAFQRLGLGTYSVLREIEFARSLGIPYYYLGYFVPGCPSMAYKDHFRPREYFCWEEKEWRPADPGFSTVVEKFSG